MISVSHGDVPAYGGNETVIFTHCVCQHSGRLERDFSKFQTKSSLLSFHPVYFPNPTRFPSCGPQTSRHTSWLSCRRNTRQGSGGISWASTTRQLITHIVITSLTGRLLWHYSIIIMRLERGFSPAPTLNSIPLHVRMGKGLGNKALSPKPYLPIQDNLWTWSSPPTL
jgi:hypothetical protein